MPAYTCKNPREIESFRAHLVISMKSNSDVDDYPLDIYNVNYIATWSDKERKSSSFHSPPIARDRTEKMRSITGTLEYILWKQIQCKVRQLKAVASGETEAI